MAKVIQFLVSAARGMRRDMPRHQLPKGAVWNMVDYLPQQGAPARKRGGWSYASPDISTVKATAGHIEVVFHAPFAAGSKLCAVDEDGELYTAASSASATDVGALGFAPSGLTFHRDTLVMAANTFTPQKYTGAGSASALSGSPPTAAYAAVYKDRTILANTSANPNRVWFSAAGNPASWDTTNAYIDTTYPITAIAALRNAILVFSTDKVERIRGDIPPPGTNMVLEGLFDQGTPNYRSVAPYGDGVIYANPSGVFLTDGASLLDLTAAGEISQYWRNSAMASYTSNYILASGVFRGYYFITVVNYPSTFVDGLACDIERRVWFRLSNIPSLFFAHSQGSAADELYFASGAEPRVGKMSSVFSPSSSVKNDANGTAVAPTIETGFTDLGGLKRIRNVHIGYDVRDSASDNPTLAVSYLTSPEASSYTSLGSLAETTAYTRKRVPVGKRANGFAFKVAQSNASSDTYLYGIEIDGHELEPSRGA